MSWLQRTLNSSVGGKAIVAITGLAMVGFVVGHLAGNLLIFAGRDAVNSYAAGLRVYPALLWAMRIGIIVAAILHIVFAIRLNLRSRAARPQAYVVKNYKAASFSSRSMVLTGLLLLFYILFHLFHFTWRTTSPEIAAFGAYDVYEMLVWSFSQPLNSITYIAAMILLGLHLSHGIQSLFQTLGVNHPKYNPLIRRAGPLLGWALALGFISIPVAIMLGIVK